MSFPAPGSVEKSLPTKLAPGDQEVGDGSIKGHTDNSSVQTLCGYVLTDYSVKGPPLHFCRCDNAIVIVCLRRRSGYESGIWDSLENNPGAAGVG